MAPLILFQLVARLGCAQWRWMTEDCFDGRDAEENAEIKIDKQTAVCYYGYC